MTQVELGKGAVSLALGRLGWIPCERRISLPDAVARFQQCVLAGKT
jgi:hypothetical protein